MTTLGKAVVCCALCAVGGGIGWAAGIRVWEANALYEIEEDGRTLHFRGPGTLKIDSLTAQGELWEIDVVDAPGVNGAVHLYVAPSAYDPYYLQGATYVHKIDLSGATESYIDQLEVEFDAADWDTPLKATMINGSVNVGGVIVAGIEAESLNAQLQCAGLGNVTLNGDLAGYIQVNGNYSHTMVIYGTAQVIVIVGALQQNGTIHVVQHVWGSIEVDGPLQGTVTVDGNLKRVRAHSGIEGHVIVGGNMDGTEQSHTIVHGSVFSGASLEVTGRLRGAHFFNNIHGTVSGGNVETLTVDGAVTGSLLTTGTSGSLSDATIDGGIGSTGLVQAAAGIENLVVRGGVAGSLLAGYALADVWIYSEDSGIAPGGLVEAAYIDHLAMGNAVDGTLRASVELRGPVDIGAVGAEGLVDIASFNGNLNVSGSVAGEIDVTQDLVGALGIGTVGGRDRGGVTGTVHIFGSVFGAISVGGSVEGSILVDGVLQDDPYLPLCCGHITIGRSLLGDAAITIGTNYTVTTEFITIHYSGFEEGDSWAPNATVTVNGTECHGDTPGLNVRSASPCKGNMDGIGEVDFDDISSFVTALTDPAGYSLEFPGLGGTYTDNYEGGSRVFHGDLGNENAELVCDEALGFGDISPFIARLSCDPPYCSPDCGDCGGDMLSAQQLAAGMRAHVPAARHPALRAFVAQVIAYHHNRGNQQQREYWAQVLARLNQ
jgi:hypothetical protein